jgi:hypothetical protein
MKNSFIGLSLFAGLVLSCSGKLNKSVTSSGEEWIDLFNGKDIKDWIAKINHHEAGENVGNTFRVEDGMIKVRYDQYGAFDDQFGHLFYKTPFSCYKLRVEYRFTGEFKKDAPDYAVLNSGVMFHSQDPRSMPKDQNWPVSVEFQFNAGLGDGRPRPTGSMCSPGTHVVFNGKLDERHCISSSSKTYEKDEWVKAELVVYGDSLITHIINGDSVLQYSKPQIGGNVVINYSPEIKIDGKLLSRGFIALQSEGQPIDFRKVELMKLNRCGNNN